MTHKYEGGVEVLVIFLYIVDIILGRFPLVHRIKIKPRIIVLDG